MAAGKMSNGDEVVLNFIKEYVEKHCYAPSVREIGDGVGMKSSSSVHCHITNLIYMGLLETDHTNTPRALRIAGYKLVKVEDGDEDENKN